MRIIQKPEDNVAAFLSRRRSPGQRSQLLDTGGGVKRALPRLGAHPFLIHNSDSLWIEGVGSNLAQLAAAWDEWLPSLRYPFTTE